MINQKGQTTVEFTLIFILALVVAWIPVDFGLAFYTAHLAQNAARDGARIAAADPNVTAAGPCALSACYSLASTHPVYRAATRVNRALMPDTQVQLTLTGSGCNQQVNMTVSGTYNFFFYRMLGWFGVTIPSGGKSISRTTSMRWEHQC
jgi:Flp pilus assembly protein TadG